MGLVCFWGNYREVEGRQAPRRRDLQLRVFEQNFEVVGGNLQATALSGNR